MKHTSLLASIACCRGFAVTLMMSIHPVPVDALSSWLRSAPHGHVTIAENGSSWHICCSQTKGVERAA
jgi:hypothetical protein